MSKKYSLILILAFFQAHIVFSQVSGYMGKRFLVNIDALSTLYFNSDNFINYFPMRNHFGVEYIYAKNSTIAVNYLRSKTQFTYSGKHYPLLNNGINLNYTKYIGASGLAPLGHYFSMYVEFSMANYNVTLPPKQIYIGNDYIMVNNDYRGEMSDFSLGFVLGESGIIRDVFRYKYGVQFAFPYGAFFNAFSNKSSDPERNSIQSAIITRNLFNNFFGIQYGISYMF